MSTAASRRRPSAAPPAHEGRHAPARPRRPQVVPGHGRRRVLRVSTVSASVLALVVLFGLVGFHALIAENQARIDALDDAIEVAERDLRVLSLQVWDLERGERIRSEAIERLGMVVPEQVVQLDPIADAQLGEPVVAVVDERGAGAGSETEGGE